MFYVLQSRPRLDYTFKNEISVLFSKKEFYNVPYLSSGLVLDYLVVFLIEVLSTYIPLTHYLTIISQIFLWDFHILSKFLSYEKYCTRDRW
jgi:hypothetical protein